ncbi:response regulator [Nocardioides sp. GY 10127]|uniref:response regulator transcription factor n=1 Tax=Nocardioides sp. GY 10127 TaxID=2569762 RepID=UPI00145911E0|nr:response regulator [Nocardioides sp. GY 10127]
MNTILLVEDDEDIAFLVRLVLTSAGCQVTTCRTADEALRHLAAAALPATPPFDLLVTDVHLPGPLDGLALVARARAEGLEPVAGTLVISASVGTADLAGYARAGVGESFLGKPFELSDLTARVRDLLERAGRPCVGAPLAV